MLRIVFLFFFFSGFSALVFEIAWLRQLSLCLGNTAQATSTILAVFLGGLALGAYLAGRFAEKLPGNPLKVYGLLECSVGLLALLVSLALEKSSYLYAFFIQQFSLSDLSLMAVRILLSALLLLLPTMLMGATLPILVRYLAVSNLSARLFSLLYGANTLGAAAGSFATCFFAFPYLGILNTLLAAASINMIIGCTAYFAVGKTTEQSEDSKNSQESDDSKLAKSQESGLFSYGAGLLYTLALMTGFTALSYEVLWTRILRCSFLSLTYSFTIMITMFLLGLALGSFIFEEYVILAKRTGGKFFRFSSVQYAAAFFCALSLPFFPGAANGTVSFMKLCGFSLIDSRLLQQLTFITLSSIPTILIPSVFIGMLFPMIATLAVLATGKSAQAVGKVYAFNTIGSVTGSLVCGLWLAPHLGSMKSFQLAVVLSAITGALSIALADKMKTGLKAILILLPLSSAFLFSCNDFKTAVPAGVKVLKQEEDSLGVMRVIDIAELNGLVLEFNGSSLASSTPSSLRYMRLLAHLPMLVHKNPQKVLLGCFGTGSTAGAASLHSELKELDIVELSKMVVEAAPLFSKSNYAVMENPKAKVRINDVRNYLLSHDTKYDIITFEPPPPQEAGVVNLYTDEFYKLVASRLNRGGIVSQWIPMHQVSAKLWKMMIKSAQSEFPYLSIWLPNRQEAIFVASKDPLVFDMEQMRARMQEPAVKESLHEVGFDDPSSILSTFIADESDLSKYIENCSSVTDDRPSLEFFMPYAGKTASELEAEEIGGRQALTRFFSGLKRSTRKDKELLLSNWQALHLIRLANNASSKEEADKLTDNCLEIMPDNEWFKYLNTHRRIIYPSPNYRAITY